MRDTKKNDEEKMKNNGQQIDAAEFKISRYLVPQMDEAPHDVGFYNSHNAT